MAFVAIPHGIGNLVGTAAMSTFDRVFDPGQVAGETFAPGPGTTERLNVLLVGLDAAPGRTAVLTDTIMVVSLDPVGKTVTMVSIPRDMVNVPLGNGDTYAPKINSLHGWAERHPEDFPGGGMAALQEAIGALLGIELHYWAEADLAGFVRMVDAVGGIDVDVKKPLDDPKYDGFGGDGRGWAIDVGRHHLGGYDALAYARIRRTAGETDFTRAERQQQVLVAIRNAAVRGDSLLFRLPALLDAVGDTVRTNLPPGRLPQLAAIAEEIDGGRTVRIVIRHPLVAPASNRYGAVQVPDIAAIRAVAAAAFTEPGVPPQAWPTPTPTPVPPSAAPSGGP
jgi:LCP family protein required for cell wall assembly